MKQLHWLCLLGMSLAKVQPHTSLLDCIPANTRNIISLSILQTNPPQRGNVHGHVFQACWPSPYEGGLFIQERLKRQNIQTVLWPWGKGACPKLSPTRLSHEHTHAPKAEMHGQSNTPIPSTEGSECMVMQFDYFSIWVGPHYSKEQKLLPRVNWSNPTRH